MIEHMASSVVELYVHKAVKWVTAAVLTVLAGRQADQLNWRSMSAVNT